MFLPKKRDRAHKEGVNLGRLLENRNSLEEIQRKTRVEEGARGEKKAVMRGMETSGSVDYHKSVSTMFTLASVFSTGGPERARLDVYYLVVFST